MCSNEKRMEGTVPFWFEFLDLYKTCRCLWDSQHQSYRNWEARKDACDLLLDKYKVINPNATHDTVRKKIDSFRSGWRREEKKVKQSLKKSTRIEDIHVPVLWFYNKLSFLTGTEEEVQKRRRTAELSTEVEIEFEPSASPELDDSVHPWSPPGKKIKTEGKYIEEGEIDPVSNAAEEGEIKTATRTFEELEEDEDAAFANHIKLQIRQLRQKQKLIAQKLISDVIFLARTEQLSYETCVNNSKSGQPPAPMPSFNPTPPIIITLPVPLANALIPNSNATHLTPNPSDLPVQNTTVPTPKMTDSDGLPVIQNSFSITEKSDTKQENNENSTEKLRELLQPKET